MKAPKHNWRYDSVTKRQKEILIALGYEHEIPTTKGEASDVISKELQDEDNYYPIDDDWGDKE